MIVRTGLKSKLTAVTIYAIAMGYLESAVVIYLRQGMFGDLIQVFPLKFMAPQIAGIELAREAATILMLLIVGYISGRNRLQQWMYFIYAFAVWDIFYYVILKILTGWPNSFLDFDVLFLIPVIWISPVLCPVLIALLLISVSIILILLSEKSSGNTFSEGTLKITPVNLGLFVAGSTIDFYSFTEQIFRILLDQGPKGLENFTPTSFNWPIFFIGYLILFISAIRIVTDYHKMLSELITDQDRKATQ